MLIDPLVVHQGTLTLPFRAEERPAESLRSPGSEVQVRSGQDRLQAFTPPKPFQAEDRSTEGPPRWTYGVYTQYLRVLVGQLRQKLEADPARPTLIATEPGIGYRFDD